MLAAAGSGAEQALDQPTATLYAAGIAAGVALLVFLFTQVFTAVMAWLDRRAQFRLKRTELKADAFVRVLRTVHLEGQAVQDESFNWTETAEDPAEPLSRPRVVRHLSRSDLAEGRALVSAYGSPTARVAYDNWVTAVDAWREFSDGLIWENDHGHAKNDQLDRKDVEPQRGDEQEARRILTDSVNASLMDAAI
jgi:hypothetical protein